MMSLKLQIIIICCVLFVMGYIIQKVRKKKIDFRFALAWLAIGIVVLVFAFFPTLLNKISSLIGIAAPVNMLFFFGFLFALCMLFTLAVEVSHLSEKVKKMSQEMAIMKKGIYENEEKLQTK